MTSRLVGVAVAAVMCQCVAQDVYVHAEVHGAASCIVRNPSAKPDAGNEIPPATLEQAGQFTVNRVVMMR